MTAKSEQFPHGGREKKKRRIQLGLELRSVTAQIETLQQQGDTFAEIELRQYRAILQEERKKLPRVTRKS